MQLLYELAHGLCDLVYPPVCLLCRHGLPQPMRNDSLCTACRARIKYNVPPFCRTCSRSLAPEHPGSVCRQCRSIPPEFDEAWGAVRYTPTMRHLIHLFKYAGKTGLAREFSRFMLTFTERHAVRLQGYDFIVPVPLHASRMRERGYNQGDLLARRIAEALDMPCLTSLLARRRATEYQARLPSKQRWTNVEGAFRIKHSDRLDGTSILVVDDLLTTGTTASEIAKVLKTSGADRVGILALAIADSDEHS